MQQMAAGNMGLLNPFVFNQFAGSYGTYAQVKSCCCYITGTDMPTTH
jgi:hypothetical protein